jgi:hypothetical protein
MMRWLSVTALGVLVGLSATAGARQTAEVMQGIKVGEDKRSFVFAGSGQRFVPWGFNYDRDHSGRLLEDYWVEEWAKVEKDFAAMKKLGANVVRIHLQVGRFMERADKPNEAALERLGRLVRLAEHNGLYLDLTGLACYHKKDVPAWYDALAEKERWAVQARFWQAIAGRCADSPAVFCYDLMNEPVVPGGRRKDGDWLGPPFVDKYYVQCITLDPGERVRAEVARQWVRTLTTAIRKVDRSHLITVGLVDWSLDRPGVMYSGLDPKKIAADLDFISAHLYPEKGKLDQDLKTLAGFDVGKPVLIEEIFPMKCSIEDLGKFIDASKKTAAGWIGFYWGKPPEELRRSKSLGDALTLQWLEFFQKHRSRLGDGSR